MLTSRGIGCRRAPIPDDPQGAGAALAAALDGLSLSDWHPVLVGNGGTKPISGDIGEVLRTAGQGGSTAPYATVYGQVPAAELWVLTQGPAGPLHRHRYRRADLSLEEVLRCSGHLLQTPARLLWPNGGAVEPIAYGTDKEATRNLHQELRRLKEWQQQAVAGGWPRYKVAETEDPAGMQRWIKRLRQMAQHLAAGRGSPREVFDGAIKLAETAGREAARKRAGVVKPGQKLGPAFEMAVARRLQSWLQRRPDAYPVTQALWGARIARQQSPETRRAELDIILVLANGIVVSLECKTFIESLEQLNARLLNLHVTGSRLAQMVICWPFYSDYVGDEWFADIYREIETTVRPIFPTLGFTLEGQPEDFLMEIEEDGAVAIKTVPCPTFENSLDALLARYTPEA